MPEPPARRFLTEGFDREAISLMTAADFRAKRVGRSIP